MDLDVYFDDLHITNLIELGQNMYKYPDLAFSLIIRDDFQKSLKENEPYLYQKFVQLQDIVDDDEFVFKVSYLFCPYMTLRYHGYRFDKLENLGERMINYGPVVDVYLMDLIKFRLLSYVYELQGLNTISKENYLAIKKAEEMVITNPNKAYFTLAFDLSKSKVLVYNGKPYITPKSFLEVMSSDVNITKFAIDFEDNEYFFAWLRFLNYENRLKRFRNLVKFIEEREKI
mgnify:FL=1